MSKKRTQSDTDDNKLESKTKQVKIDTQESKTKQVKTDTHTQESIVRDVIITKSISDKQTALKFICWNVAGLRALVKNFPSILGNIIDKHSPDIIILQETKLQKEHEEDFTNLIDGYHSIFLSSSTKKGYSGLAIFLKKLSICVLNPELISKSKDKVTNNLSTLWGSKNKTVEDKSIFSSNLMNVEYELKDPKFTGEGRTLTLEFDSFYLVACYVPNSGQNLERLQYRTEDWDLFMRNYLKELADKKPVIFGGDLNCAHLDIGCANNNNNNNNNNYSKKIEIMFISILLYSLL